MTLLALRSPQMTWTSVALCCLLTFACTEGGSRARGLSAESSMQYLVGDLTAAQLERELRLPTFTTASPGVTEQRRLLRESPRHYDYYFRATKRGSPAGRSEDFSYLSLSRLADSEAERYILGERVDLAGLVSEHYEPAWLADHQIGIPDAYRSFGHALRKVIEDHFSMSRLRDLRQIHELYDDVYCLRQNGVSAHLTLSNSTGASFMIDGDYPSNLQGSTGQRGHLPTNSLGLNSLEKDVKVCHSAEYSRLWPLPYDIADVWEWYRFELRSAIELWISRNRNLVPNGLTLVT